MVAASGEDRAFRPMRDVPFPAMRLIVARCEVRYSGRLDALLPEALRLLMIKSDGSVMVHADTGGYKPQTAASDRSPPDGARSGRLRSPKRCCLSMSCSRAVMGESLDAKKEHSTG